MSLASILNDNDDINFPELICGNLTADIITARVINGGGGGGGNFSTPATQLLNMSGNIIDEVDYVGFVNQAGGSNATLSLCNTMVNGKSSITIQEGIYGGTPIGVVYDSHYNPPPGITTFTGSTVSPTLQKQTISVNAGALVLGRHLLNVTVVCDTGTSYATSTQLLTYKWDGTLFANFNPALDIISTGVVQYISSEEMAIVVSLNNNQGNLIFVIYVNGLMTSMNYTLSYTDTVTPCGV
jgi:hypothetical protein